MMKDLEGLIPILMIGLYDDGEHGAVMTLPAYDGLREQGATADGIDAAIELLEHFRMLEAGRADKSKLN